MEKKVKKLENKILTFGNTQINSDSLGNMTKDELWRFIKLKLVLVQKRL